MKSDRVAIRDRSRWWARLRAWACGPALSQYPTFATRGGKVEFRGRVAGRYRIWLGDTIDDIWRLVAKEIEGSPS